MAEAADHGRLMDDVYRYQRFIYDLSRKYFLLGRDHLIRHMEVQPGETVLEIACGTGRNLAAIRRRYPGARLHGLDISQQMLRSARSKLGPHVALARADACDFDPMALFGVRTFDHVVLSYSLSMIPDWTAALDEALRHQAPFGRLHVVDFGDQSGLPHWFRRMLNAWLGRFHVSPRLDIPAELQRRVGHDHAFERTDLLRHYAVYARLTRRS